MTQTFSLSEAVYSAMRALHPGVLDPPRTRQRRSFECAWHDFVWRSHTHGVSLMRGGRASTLDPATFLRLYVRALEASPEEATHAYLARFVYKMGRRRAPVPVIEGQLAIISKIANGIPISESDSASIVCQKTDPMKARLRKLQRSSINAKKASATRKIKQPTRPSSLRLFVIRRKGHRMDEHVCIDVQGDIFWDRTSPFFRVYMDQIATGRALEFFETLTEKHSWKVKETNYKRWLRWHTR